MVEHRENHSLNSAIYEGTVWHRRHQHCDHEFSYQVFMVYLDLAEIDAFVARSSFWSSVENSSNKGNGSKSDKTAGKPLWGSIAQFDRKEYFVHPNKPTLNLDDAVRSAVYDAIAYRPSGPIRLLTNLRYFGYLTNPISVYYCFDDAGEKLDAILLEVTNTPWGERQPYVLDCRGEHSASDRINFDKLMHVSPFMPMDMEYQWQGAEPSEALQFSLSMFDQNTSERELRFAAGVNFKRSPATRKNLNRVLIRYPLMTVKVIASIYWQAFKLWYKGAVFHRHPQQENAERHLSN